MTSRGPEVVTLGECLVALVADEPVPIASAERFHRHVAGAEANVAVGLARLGRQTAFIGRVGGDALGTIVLRALRGEGVDVTEVVVDPAAPTALLVRDRRSMGAIEVVYHRAGSAGSRLSAEDVRHAEPLFAGARWLHLSGITPALSGTCREAVTAALELADRHGLAVSLDLNLRRQLWSDADAAATLRGLVAGCAVVLASRDEGAAVAGLPLETPTLDVAAALLSLGARTAVVKLGPGGALALAPGGQPVERAAPSVPLVVDPVGAGDAFCAGFLAARLEGLSEDAALELANTCGACAVAVAGDQPGLPTRAELGLMGHRFSQAVLR